MLADILGRDLGTIHLREGSETHPLETLGEYQTGNTWLGSQKCSNTKAATILLTSSNNKDVKVLRRVLASHVYGVLLGALSGLSKTKILTSW